jgi:hypothetical protein
MSESELPPARVRGQRSSTCKVCERPIRFYPRPLSSGEPLATSGPEPGQWAHLEASAWRENPHEAVPADEDA